MSETSGNDRMRARVLRLRRIAANQAAVFRKGGLAGNVAFFRRWWRDRLPRGTYANGLRLFLDERAAARHRRRRARPVLLVPIGGARPEAAARAAELGALVAEPWDGADWAIVREAAAAAGGADVVLLEAGGALPTARDLDLLVFAADTYAIDRGRVGVVTPRLRPRSGDPVEGFEWDRAARAWSVTPPDPRFGRTDVPRYVLAAPTHGLTVTAAALAAAEPGDGLRPDARGLVRAAWRSGLRTLALPFVSLDVDAVPTPVADAADLAWRTGRAEAARTPDGRLSIVYVLKATTISGGIRTVFEQSRVMREAGHDVEIWSLQGEPDWIENTVPIRTFRDLAALREALEDSDAIAVSTWWETELVVWLACVDRGIPVNYMQEFETWFFPGDPITQSAVAAGYRREMDSITIADYQKDELAEIGVDATTISSAYDPEKFHPLADVARRDDTVLAVGRTFFQKNFAMTLEAWRSLGDARPRFQLFGFEPELVDDARMVYAERPSDAEVNVLYTEATCFVQTSLHEGFCLPVLEAMAAGCPVITTDSHGNRDFCEPEVNCVMVEQHDVAGLAAAIERVMGDADLRERLSVAGLRTAAERTWPVIAARMVDRFASLD